MIVELNPAILAAIDEYKPRIAASYTTTIERHFAYMVEKLGPTLKGVYNSAQFARMFRGTIAAVCNCTQADIFAPLVYTLDPAKLAAAATRYAEAVTAELRGKIIGKLGELESAEVVRMGADCTFTIRGTRGGHEIAILQQSILKVSSKGVLFNQWPARIYVDGKFTPEAKYKAMF